MVTAPPALVVLCLVDHLGHAGLLVLRVQVAHRALGDEDLDLAVQGVGEVLRQVHGEAVGILDELGVDEDLVGLAEAECELELLKQFAVLF